MAHEEFVYTGSDNLEVMAGAKNYNRYLIEQVQGAIPAGGTPRILDFGAGAGTYAVMLKEAGTVVECLEPDASLQGAIRSHGLAVVPAADAVADGSYDLVYSLNVFEHIEDDSDAARTVFAKLRPGGRAVIYVPAFMVLFTSMDRKVGHYRRYRKSQLVALLRDAGLEIDHARYCDPLGFFASLLFRFVGNNDGDLDPRAVKLFDRAVFPLSRFLERVTGPAFGKNVVVVARRPA